MHENPQITQTSQKDLEVADVRDSRTHAIIGAAMAVHRALGCGFLERVYQDALAVEFQARGMPAAREAELPIHSRGALLPSSYRADFIVFESVIVELKALPALGDVEVAQVINYLKASPCAVGLLLNFGRRSLEFRRVDFTRHEMESVESA